MILLLYKASIGITKKQLTNRFYHKKNGHASIFLYFFAFFLYLIDFI